MEALWSASGPRGTSSPVSIDVERAGRSTSAHTNSTSPPGSDRVEGDALVDEEQ